MREITKSLSIARLHALGKMSQWTSSRVGTSSVASARLVIIISSTTMATSMRAVRYRRQVHMFVDIMLPQSVLLLQVVLTTIANLRTHAHLSRRKRCSTCSNNSINSSPTPPFTDIMSSQPKHAHVSMSKNGLKQLAYEILVSNPFAPAALLLQDPIASYYCRAA